MLASRFVTLAAAALVLAGAATARAAEPGATAPAQGTGRVVNLRDLSCAQYMEVPEADRAPVLWYIAGFYRARGVQALRFDLDRASTGLSKVAATCQKRPDASLRYTVRDMFAAEAQPKKAKKAKGTAATAEPAAR